MKVAISASSQGLDAPLDPRFGRSPYFVIIDTEAGTTESLTNDNVAASGGAGIQTAQLLADQGVQVVITGRVGPKAAQVLSQGEIEIYETNAGTVREAWRDFERASREKDSGHPAMLSPRRENGRERISDSVVAIATESATVAPHFGHCPQFTIVTVRDGEIRQRKVIANPGHRPGFLPRYLADLGIDCIIAGGMGSSAQQLFAERGIKTITGIQGPVDNAAEAYIAGQLQAGESLCDHDR